MLTSSNLEFLMEAHNGLSARIVREAGFKGIWGSGLSISAALGVRDNNEASWTQVVDVLEFMADASDLPILLDGDTGYGNFNNMRRLVRKLEQRGIAGVCIEDKQFPKTNSFIDGERQPLAEIDEFAGKIKAGKDSQTDPDFSIVARVEALIAGWGMDEALRRAHAYADAGADAILMHSKLSRPDEILEFARQWNNRAPIVIVPTKYYSTPTDVFRQAGISTVIWANHLVRSAAASMQATARDIFENQTLVNVEDRVATVNEIFRLQDADEYSAAERIYLSSSSRSSNSAIVLAARQIAGFTVAEPFNAAAEQLGIGKVLRFTGDVWRNHACCTIFMHEQDLTQRAGWSQKVVDAIVKAQLWTRAHPQDAAKLLSREGVNHYTPHASALLGRVLAPPPGDAGRYLGDRAIQHADWHEKRIDFQPYPFPSYTEELVRRLKTTQTEGANGFLAQLDPAFAARDLVDDRFVKKSIEAAGGMAAFGLPAGYARKETILV
ncbi:phosphoenolpyruvate mutase [Burkholderia gladioli]|uniref:phosphoenolpyruvate mutase n=1 Tax=Burkholderia gladioli TaxID=28095 RepID=UPI001FC89245|nr:phosphoenolpyruvate mutase [Burkholderia gladioli]